MSVGLQRKDRRLLKVLVLFLDKQVSRPSLKALLFAYLYVVLPRVFNTVIISIRKREYENIIPRLTRILIKAIHPLRFPMFCAKLVAGINFLEPLVYQLLKVIKINHPVHNLFISTLMSSFVSSYVNFPLFQKHMVTYGRYLSLDLTLLVVTRACDTILSSSLSKLIPISKSSYGDALLFIISSYFIMFSWFYYPETLPPSYCNWITSAANMDREIVKILKDLREGKVRYGEYTSDLSDYCKRYNEDPKQGDLVTDQPLKCKTVHAFQTDNCELHALWRFARGFSFAIKIYGPLNLLMLLTPKKNVKLATRIIKAVKSSIRSSCFLGAYISFFWYSVCLARTRLFPIIFPQIPKTRFDDTIAPALGSVLCGFSSFIESAQRRKELALFVAPRALGTLISSKPSKLNLQIEAIAFSISMAILVAFCKKDPTSVRGIFGKGVQQVFNVNNYT